MDPLHVLATELVLEVLRHVSLPDLAAVQRLNKAWYELFTSNQDAIFKETAVHTLRVQPPCDRLDAKHQGWKEICQCDVNSHLMRKHKIITVDHVPYSTDFHPWRIKLDRPHQLLFASTADLPSDFLPDPTRPMDLPHPHGLTVIDLRTKRIVQTIPEVKQYAHLEYDSGYLVTTGDTMTIYRTPWAVPSTNASASPQSARPQIETPPTNDESETARDEPPLSAHGTITSRGFRALRMMGRTLATASDTRIQIFDVPTLQLVKTIEIPRRQIAMIMYIELDDEYVFLCGSGYAAPLPPLRAETILNVPPPEPHLYVYHRNPTSSSSAAAYFTIPLRGAAGGDPPPYPSIVTQLPGVDSSLLARDPRFNVHVQGGKRCVAAEIAPFELTSRVHGRDMVIPFVPDVPVACHYGSQHLVVLCRNGSLLLVQDYKTTFSLPESERVNKIFSLSMPSDGPEYWNLAVQDDVAYVTSYQDRLFDPWAILIAIDLTTLQRSPYSSSSSISPIRDALRSVAATGQIDVRSWDIPLPCQLASTHSLQATSEGVYMPVRIVAMEEHHPDSEFAGVDDIWLPPDYKYNVRSRTDVLCLRYSRH